MKLSTILIINSYRKILYYFGSMMLVMSGLLLTPLIYLIFVATETANAPAFLFAALISLSLYLVFGRLLGRRDGNAMSYNEASLSVFLSWLVSCVVSAIPLVILNRMSFTNAYFEAMSGYTTTGLSLIDYAATPNLIYLWRSIMQYAGGAGIAIILISLANAPYGSGLSSAEGKVDLLVPQIQRSARLVMVIYSIYALVGIIFLKVAGMGWFDSVIHTFGAISTGGFSNHPESIAWFNSLPVEAVVLVMMILGNLNFLNAYLLFGGKLKAFFHNGEVKVQMLLIPAAAITIAMLFATKLYGSIPSGIRISIFETVSAITTTGYSATTYANWPEIGLLILSILMLIGGGTNSTAGGFKQFRLFFAYKSFIQNLKEMTSPAGRIVRLSYWWGQDKQFITPKLIQNLLIFAAAYFGIFILGVLVMVAYGIPFMSAFFEFASTLSNSGLSVGITSVGLPKAMIWFQTLVMFLGRLEILIVFVVGIQVFRDIKRLI